MNQYDYLKDKLHDYKVKVDKEKIWKKTAHAIPQRSKRRALLFFLMGLLLVSGWLGYTLFNPTQVSSKAENSNQVESEFANDVISENLPEPPTSLTKNTSVQKKPDTPQKSKQEIQSVSGKGAKTRKSVAKKPNSKNADISSFEVHEIKEVNVEINQVNSISDSEKNSLSVNQENAPSILPIVPTSERSCLAPTALLPNSSWSFPGELNSIDPGGEQIPIISIDDANKRISFSVIAAIGLSTIDIAAVNSESSEMTDLFNNTVRNLEHLSVDFSGRLPLPNDLAVEANLGWNQWTTETQQKTTSYQTFIREGITSILIDENGVQQSVLGSVNGLQIIHKNLVRYTQYQTIAADISLHKVLWRKNRIFVDAFADGSVMILDHAKGSTYDLAGELQKFSNEDNPFVRKSLFGFGGGLKMNYHISPHMRIVGTLGYHPVKYQWQQQQQKIEWTHSKIHGKIGVCYQIN